MSGYLASSESAESRGESRCSFCVLKEESAALWRAMSPRFDANSESPATLYAQGTAF